jgi:hypothetical protein
MTISWYARWRRHVPGRTGWRYIARLADHNCRLMAACVTTQARILFRQRDVDIVVVTFERVDVGGVSYITTNRAICLAAGSTVAVICFNSCDGDLRCAAK